MSEQQVMAIMLDDNDYSSHSTNSFWGHSEPFQIFNKNSQMITPKLIRAVGMLVKYVTSAINAT